uniref:Galactosylgalactosylxylosylprotein 3-beta-glucuronosyltransferase n=1 Tax=Heligmosomoides polygyrus TaxID=6339 RepID=A0A183GWD7_HELPZ
LSGTETKNLESGCMRQSAPPLDAPPLAQLSLKRPAEDDFVRVRLLCYSMREQFPLHCISGLVGGAWVEAPKVGESGRIESWDVMYAPKREFATDMAGFAIHVGELFRVKNATFSRDCAKTAGLGPESCFLTQFGFKKQDAEPFGHNDVPKDILVWHTKTSKTKGSGPLRGFVME